MLASSVSRLVCVLSVVWGAAAVDRIVLLDSAGFGFGNGGGDMGRNAGDSVAITASEGGQTCSIKWTRQNTERVDCLYTLPSDLPAQVPGGGSVFLIEASTETNGVFDGEVFPGCQGLQVNSITDVGDPSLTDALKLDCTGTVGGSSSTRPLCFDGTANLKRC